MLSQSSTQNQCHTHAVRQEKTKSVKRLTHIVKVFCKHSNEHCQSNQNGGVLHASLHKHYKSIHKDSTKYTSKNVPWRHPLVPDTIYKGALTQKVLNEIVGLSRSRENIDVNIIDADNPGASNNASIFFAKFAKFQ